MSGYVMTDDTNNCQQLPAALHLEAAKAVGEISLPRVVFGYSMRCRPGGAAGRDHVFNEAEQPNSQCTCARVGLSIPPCISGRLGTFSRHDIPSQRATDRHSSRLSFRRSKVSAFPPTLAYYKLQAYNTTPCSLRLRSSCYSQGS